MLGVCAGRRSAVFTGEGGSGTFTPALRGTLEPGGWSRGQQWPRDGSYRAGNCPNYVFLPFWLNASGSDKMFPLMWVAQKGHFVQQKKNGLYLSAQSWIEVGAVEKTLLREIGGEIAR